LPTPLLPFALLLLASAAAAARAFSGSWGISSLADDVVCPASASRGGESASPSILMGEMSMWNDPWLLGLTSLSPAAPRRLSNSPISRKIFSMIAP
jgi:hypothetical protein